MIPLGRVGEAKPVQKANGGTVDMAVRLNDAGKQGPSFQVKHPGVRSCHRSDLGIAPQLHDPVTLDRDGLVDTSHLGGGGFVVHAHDLAIDKDSVGITPPGHLGGQLLCKRSCPFNKEEQGQGGHKISINPSIVTHKISFSPD